MNLYDSLKYVIIFQCMNGTSFLKRVDSEKVAITKSSVFWPCLNYVQYIGGCAHLYFTGLLSENLITISTKLPLASYTIRMLFITQFIGFLVIVVITWVKRNKELNFYERLLVFDEELMKNFHCDFKYKSVRLQSAVVAVGIVASGFGLYIGTVMANSKLSDSYLIFAPFIVQMTMMSCVAFAFCNCTHLLKIRFRILQIIANENGRTVDDIKLIFKFYKKLHSLIGVVNDVHGLKELFSILNDFIIITIELFFTFSILANSALLNENWGLAVLGLCWVVPHVLKIFLVCFGSHTALLEAKATARVLENLSLTSQSYQLWQSSDFFSLGSIHYANDFNASEFFTIDMTLVFAIISAICTYFVVMLQFSDA